MINGILQKAEIEKLSQPVENVKEQVFPYIDQMVGLCSRKIGVHVDGAIALAHCQIEKENPLTFFVFETGEVIVNPVILDFDVESKFTHMEGCLSLAFRRGRKVPRFNRIKVAFIRIFDRKVVKEKGEWVEGIRACVFQHEMDHFENKYIM